LVNTTKNGTNSLSNTKKTSPASSGPPLFQLVARDPEGDGPVRYALQKATALPSPAASSSTQQKKQQSPTDSEILGGFRVDAQTGDVFFSFSADAAMRQRWLRDEKEDARRPMQKVFEFQAIATDSGDFLRTMKTI
jgi:hypothetical protein